MREIIKAEIVSHGGSISFKQFMHLCLYHSEVGYYQSDRERTGTRGDFFTSANVSSVYGEIVAGYLFRMWEQLGEPEVYHIVEYGAGKGQLAEAILQKISSYPKLFSSVRYVIIEASKSFIREQQERLKDYPVDWVASLRQHNKPVIGCILSNELIDAFPVHWVRYEADELFEHFVQYDEQIQDFVLLRKPASTELNEYFVEQQLQLLEGQNAEVNLEAKEWLAQCAEYLHRGYIITIDYGFLKDELYAAHRHKGTLLCYHKHGVNDEPLKHVGEQDITSHVNFSQLISWGEQLNLQTQHYMNQQEFLIKGGILGCFQALETPNPLHPNFKKNAAIRQLIMHDGMGDTFKVLIQSKSAPEHVFST